jgi:hypothetical protein
MFGVKISNLSKIKISNLFLFEKLEILIFFRGAFCCIKLIQIMQN